MEIPYEVTPRRDTGLYNAKLGVWLFLASEVMLFGGLFSGYVFLRLGVQEGVDNPWPWGYNVHGPYVWAGFINTLVLIFSSVGVVFAWVALKERNWKAYQTWMYIVVACAVAFMCIKTIEYKSKLTEHHGIKFQDNSVIEGKILDQTDKIRFEGKEVSMSLQSALPAFLKDIDGDFPTFTVKEGPEGTEGTELNSYSDLKSWYLKQRREASSSLAEERKRYRSELDAGNANPTPVSVVTSATLTAGEPFKLHGNPRKIVGHSDSALNYKDGSKVEGMLIDDTVKFEIHQVDMQLVLPQKQKDSMVWEVVDDDSVKKQFFEAQAKMYKEMRDYYEPRGEMIPEKMLRGHKLNLQKVHMGGHHDEEHHAEANVHKSESKPSAEGAAEEAHDDHGHGEHAYIEVPREKIKFMGNHGPRYGNYYAIYFTMTALHGLHVIGGALVLLFFTVFGKKLYLKNPEHLANRVEVGGLFWHFVDLIWIFLFPIFYLF
ncbi:MAG: hypothetical protein CMO55_27080 [Verrucomicrobiales bacterium]|nr:hypothetical protein [Verrucomicrobiales bacterium]